MNTVQKLAELFAEFPGIGPRQSKRFVYFLLTKNNGFLENFAKLIISLKKETMICPSCFRFFGTDESKEKTCKICNDKNRDKSILMIVSRDVDFENIEKTHTFNGKYFILGGTIPILEKEPEKKIRLKELFAKIESEKTIKEIILAMSANPEGENTTDFIKNKLNDISEKRDIKISILGRGLSTGTELEYSDSDTIKYALKNRL